MNLTRQERYEIACSPQSPSPLGRPATGDGRERARRSTLGVTLCLCLGSATPALASDEAVELWLSPSLRGQLDDNTALRLETAQRFRDADDGRVDTYFARLWVSQQVSQHFTVEGAVERRENDGGRDETRLLQQVVAQHGIFRNRLRLEQRFIEDTPQTGWRLRSEHGVRIDLDNRKKWFFRADAEFFFTLQSSTPGGQTGFTEQRAQAGLGRRFDRHFSASLSYKRVQTIRRDRPDLVGHIPMLHLDYSF
jgi:hypothetical protein